jgi:hypothetical protein
MMDNNNIELKKLSTATPLTTTHHSTTKTLNDVEQYMDEYYAGENDEGDAYYIHYEDAIDENETTLNNKDKKKSLSLDFDEKDELLITNELDKDLPQIVSSISSKSFIRSISSGLNAASDLSPPQPTTTNINGKETEINNNTPTKNANKTGKSQFYLPDNIESNTTSRNNSYSQHSSISDLFNGLTMLPKNVFKEKPIAGLHNVSCVYSSNSLNVNTLRTDNVCIPGRLLLTNFKLAFLPYSPCKYDASKIFMADRRLELFRNTHSPLDFVIPLSFVHDIKACKFV